MSDKPRHVKLTIEERNKVVKTLTERHRAHLASGETFLYDGHVSHGEVELRVELANADDTDVLTLEGRVDLVENDIQDPAEGKHLLMDFLDEVLIEYFEDDRDLRPDLDWKSYDYQSREVWVRGERRNRKLDRLADELLNSGGA